MHDYTHSKHTDKSSPVAEMGDRGHNRHGPKRGRGAGSTSNNVAWAKPPRSKIPN